MPEQEKQKTKYTTDEERTLPSQAEGERNPGDSEETIDTSAPDQAEGERDLIEEDLRLQEKKQQQ